ncbi:MAG: YggS family pyridoxal phosphate-dependent enzyme [Clostridiales Family XIII bacterium]|jgi:pyridoxal phosphate enzyme (YggS family)|nr:YggS family pyridoxal phosphate-dependent enzyme [Clostridiales Family XIII bacterium]
MTIAENIREIRGRIAAAETRAGRAPGEVTLICVTKTRTVEEMMEAVRAGALDLGENRVQEMTEKYANMQDMAVVTEKKYNIKWHLIGQLQRNKVKYIIGKTTLIHSVDSFRLAEEIERRAEEAGVDVDVLIQVNPAGEAQKAGVSLPEAEALVSEIESGLTRVQVTGLMSVVPIAGDPEEVRGYFREVKQAFDKIAISRPAFRHLSMGMTHDYEVAIEEGATMVRVGTGIFRNGGQ